MDNFDAAVNHVFSEEGGLVDHPLDPGGRTNFGITQRVLDATLVLNWSLPRLPKVVDSLTLNQARDIYRHHYWTPIRGSDLPRGLGLFLLDTAVNHGCARAVKFLQLALGVTADGWIGARTIAAAYEQKQRRILTEVSARRAHHYMLQDSIDDEFGLGWARRLFRTYNAALKEIL